MPEEEALIKRIMPNSLEAEQSLIGSMIMDRDAILTASELLVKEDFYHQQYGLLFEAMVELLNDREPVDLITLQNKLREKNAPQEISSLEYVRELYDALPTSANAKYYAQIIKDKSLLRRMIRTTEGIANDCYQGVESVGVLLEQTEKKIFDLLQNNGGEDFVPIKQVVSKPREP